MKSLFIFLFVVSATPLMGANLDKASKSFFYDLAADSIMPPSEERKAELALEKCIEQSKRIASGILGEREEYIDYVVSKVSATRRYDEWEQKK